MAPCSRFRAPTRSPRSRPGASSHAGCHGAVTSRKRLGALSAAIATCLCMPLHAQSSPFSGTVALSSQLVDRGLPVTSNTPTMQGAAAWSSPSGWSLGISASAELRSPGTLAESMAQASRSWALSSDWQMQASVIYYSYTGDAQTRVYDRGEAGVTWIYRDILTFDLAAVRVIGSSDHRPRAAADVGFHWPLIWNFSLSAGAGLAQSLSAPRYYAHAGAYDHNPSGTYAYGQTGLIWNYGHWQLALDRILTSQDARRLGGNLNASPWVATMSRSF
ncbi:MAG: TorF family putative porin [Dyella sp.]